MKNRLYDSYFKLLYFLFFSLSCLQIEAEIGTSAKAFDKCRKQKKKATALATNSDDDLFESVEGFYRPNKVSDSEKSLAHSVKV